MDSTVEVRGVREEDSTVILDLRRSLAEEMRRRQEAELNLEEQRAIVAQLQVRISKVNDEKQKMLNELEREEEWITNNLQKKLNAAKQENIEVECEVARLRAQLTKMTQDREDVLRKVEHEEEQLTNSLTKRLNVVLGQKQDLEVSLSRELNSRGSTRSNSIDESPSRRNSSRIPLTRSSSNSNSNASSVLYKFL